MKQLNSLLMLIAIALLLTIVLGACSALGQWYEVTYNGCSAKIQMVTGVDGNSVTAYTQDGQSANVVVGGQFSLCGGSVTISGVQDGQVSFTNIPEGMTLSMSSAPVPPAAPTQEGQQANENKVEMFPEPVADTSYSQPPQGIPETCEVTIAGTWGYWGSILEQVVAKCNAGVTFDQLAAWNTRQGGNPNAIWENQDSVQPGTYTILISPPAEQAIVPEPWPDPSAQDNQNHVQCTVDLRGNNLNWDAASQLVNQTCGWQADMFGLYEANRRPLYEGINTFAQPGPFAGWWNLAKYWLYPERIDACNWNEISINSRGDFIVWCDFYSMLDEIQVYAIASTGAVAIPMKISQGVVGIITSQEGIITTLVLADAIADPYIQSQAVPLSRVISRDDILGDTWSYSTTAETDYGEEFKWPFPWDGTGADPTHVGEGGLTKALTRLKAAEAIGTNNFNGRCWYRPPGIIDQRTGEPHAEAVLIEWTFEAVFEGSTGNRYKAVHFLRSITRPDKSTLIPMKVGKGAVKPPPDFTIVEDRNDPLCLEAFGYWQQLAKALKQVMGLPSDTWPGSPLAP